VIPAALGEVALPRAVGEVQRPGVLLLVVGIGVAEIQDEAAAAQRGE